MQISIYEIDNVVPDDSNESKDEEQDSKVLCEYCKRTISNGIRCLGMCVADNDY